MDRLPPRSIFGPPGRRHGGSMSASSRRPDLALFQLCPTLGDRPRIISEQDHGRVIAR